VREKTSIEKESQKEGKGWWSGSSVRPWVQTPVLPKKKNWEGKEWNKLEETNTNNNNDDNHNKFKGTKVPH
jgi:hypothetical protein